MASKTKGGTKGSKKDGVGGGLVCAHCKKVGELDTMKQCSRCRRVSYCSVACQKLHWKGGGHKKVCGKEGGRGTSTSSGGAGASGGVDAPLQHPCPICLDQDYARDDRSAMCYSCGEMFCGSCNLRLGEHGVTNCPICRAEKHPSDKDMVRLLQQLVARSGGRHTPTAQRTLGVCYANGTGVVRDPAEALRWYRLAADQGEVCAQYNIGICYLNGTGVVRNPTDAMPWFRLAAEQGFASAQSNLGVCYATGTGVVQDPAEAMRWYRLAADQGDAGAQFNIGAFYLQGTGVPKDLVEAVRFLRLAADQGHAEALTGLAKYGFLLG